MKTKLIGLLISVSLLLLGCTEEFELNSENIISAESELSPYLKSAEERIYELYPENVKNGVVSENIYLETNRFITSFGNYVTKITSLQKQVNDNRLLYSDPEFKKTYFNVLDDFDVFIKGFHTRPATDADFEITRNFNDILYYYSLITASYRDFINSKGTSHSESILSYNNSVKTSYLAIADSLEKYDLYKNE